MLDYVGRCGYGNECLLLGVSEKHPRSRAAWRLYFKHVWEHPPMTLGPVHIHLLTDSLNVPSATGTPIRALVW